VADPAPGRAGRVAPSRIGHAVPVIAHRDGRGEPLLLIHGLGLAWRCWKPVLPALERAHDVVAVDLPGFGAAPPLDGTGPTVDALADAVEADLAAEGLDGVHLAGNSLGGWIALELARRGRARSVVALAPSGLELPPERAVVISLNEAMRLRAKAAARIAGALASNALSRAAVLGPLRSRPWRVPRADAAAEIRDFGRCPGFQPTLRWTTGTRTAAGLRDIDVPARICTGTRDVMLGAFTAPRFAESIPQADLVVLRGCGHVPMNDDPAAVAQAIVAVTARAS
jgi:pimeloyl-ACP methyl ester carboxylesterase